MLITFYSIPKCKYSIKIRSQKILLPALQILAVLFKPSYECKKSDTVKAGNDDMRLREAKSIIVIH